MREKWERKKRENIYVKVYIELQIIGIIVIDSIQNW